MQLLSQTVPQGWPESNPQTRAQLAGLWRRVQVLVVCSTLASLLTSFLPLPPPWPEVLQTSLSFALFGTISVWVALRAGDNAGPLVFRAYTVFLLGALILGFASPHTRAQVGLAGTLGVTFAAALAPLLTLAVFVWLYRQSPGTIQQLGVSQRGLALHLLLGSIIGGALGLHLLLNAEAMIGIPWDTAYPGSVILWSLFYGLALRAPGEELLFRGVSFPLLRNGLRYPLWRAVAEVSLLNVLVYLPAASLSTSSIVGLYLILYRLALAVAHCLLRYHSASTIPSLASNVLFGVVTAIVLQ